MAKSQGSRVKSQEKNNKMANGKLQMQLVVSIVEPTANGKW